MTKVRGYICFSLLIFISLSACKSEQQREDESIATGIKDYDLPGGYYLGQSLSDASNYTNLLWARGDMTHQDGDAYLIVPVDTFKILSTVSYHALNNRIVSQTYSAYKFAGNRSGIKTDQLVDKLIAKYGEGHAGTSSIRYWLHGNMRIDRITPEDGALFTLRFSDIPSIREEALQATIKDAMQSSPEYRLAMEYERKYQIVAARGDLMEMHAQAELCAHCYLEMGDQSNYNKWKDVADNMARRLGVPVYRSK